MKVFISYRHSDTGAEAALIAGRLREIPEIKDVYLDIERREPGINFKSRTDEKLVDSNICIALIGEDWDGVDAKTGTPRIHQENDLVRHEIALALASNVRLLPVLVNRTSMPHEEDLPENIRETASIDAVFLRHMTRNSDMRVIRDAILGKDINTPDDKYFVRFFHRHPIIALSLRTTFGLVIAAIGLVFFTLIYNEVWNRTLGESVGDLTAALIVIGWLTAGAAIPIWLSLRR